MLGASHAFAAGFALQENSGSGLGNAYAGGAASAEDASTVWFNPAGMSRLPNQLVAAINGIGPSAKFSNGASTAPAGQTTLGDNGGDAGSWAAVPNLYVVLPISKDWAFGLGVNAPFGLVTEYDDSFIGRFQAIKSDVKTYNVNPALSYRFGGFSVGAAANYQHIKATFTSMANYSGALLSAAATAGIAPGSPTFGAIAASTPNLQSGVNVTGSDDAWGWNVGMMYEVDKNLRWGAAYRSSIKYTVSGNVDFSNPSIPSTVPAALAPTVAALAAGVNSKALYNSGVYANIELPQMANISLFWSPNAKWDIMADAQWTGWSSIPDLTFIRTDGTTLSSTPENFKDVWRFSVGTTYHYNDQWLFRAGVAYDQSPVQDQDRTPRLPDSDRTWLSFGTQYKMNNAWKFDVGATYIWIKDGSINNNGGNAAQYGLLNGTYNNNVVIVSGQATYSF